MTAPAPKRLAEFPTPWHAGRQWGRATIVDAKGCVIVEMGRTAEEHDLADIICRAVNAQHGALIIGAHHAD